MEDEPLINNCYVFYSLYGFQIAMKLFLDKSIVLKDEQYYCSYTKNNLVGMVDRMKSENHYYLVLDYCNGSDLESYLKIIQSVSEDVARLIVKQIV